MSLERFKSAQDAPTHGFASALAELRAGRKQSHWIWYVFPQLSGLGWSSNAQYYALQNMEEAGAYLRDPVLRPRLEEVTKAVADQLDGGVELMALMGGRTDGLKLVSSLTLFEIVARKHLHADPSLAPFLETCGRVLAHAGRQGFARCAFTQRQASHPK
jgi:uncharacterized protein (DUF1810 family)